MTRIVPDRKVFLKSFRSSPLFILKAEFFSDTITPISAYMSIPKKTNSFLLESVEGEEKIARFSFVGFEPLVILSTEGKTATLIDTFKHTKVSYPISENPLVELQKLLNRFDKRTGATDDARFSGGFVGYLGYDNVRFFEKKLLNKQAETAESAFLFTKYLIVFDHKEKNIICFAFIQTSGCQTRQQASILYKKETDALQKVIDHILKPQKHCPIVSGKGETRKVRPLTPKAKFLAAVKKAKEYIRQGEIIQVVLSQKFQIRYSKDPFLAYRYLRILNPSAYLYYLHIKNTVLIGASPEMLLRVENKRLYTRPIAGTRVRGANDQQDKEFEKELLKDEKEKAEHIMLVDLGRNDLGKVAVKGTVQVPLLMNIERFSHVMHLVSEVQGVLRADKTPLDSLRACFPAGTLTGAPKIRAMQLIDELEISYRDLYGGCVGYFSFNGNIDTAITIRSILFRNGIASIQAGAGIVLDSIPEREYKETLNKAKAQILALQYALRDNQESKKRG